jgi:hypothetical protein
LHRNFTLAIPVIYLLFKAQNIALIWVLQIDFKVNVCQKNNGIFELKIISRKVICLKYQKLSTSVINTKININLSFTSPFFQHFSETRIYVNTPASCLWGCFLTASWNVERLPTQLLGSRLRCSLFFALLHTLLSSLPLCSHTHPIPILNHSSNLFHLRGQRFTTVA